MITPSNLAFEIKSELPIEMRVGALIDYRIKIGPVPMAWRTEIVAWEPGVRFVDVQQKGPYRAWWHEHRFEDRGDHTLMEDTVYYKLPLGPLGAVAHRLHVSGMLRRIFEYRSRAIAWRFARSNRSAIAPAEQAAPQAPRAFSNSSSAGASLA